MHSRDILRQTIVNKCLRWFAVIGGRYKEKPPIGLQSFQNCLEGAPYRVTDVNVKGKFMWWTLESPVDTTWYLWTTYGMSGQWTVGRELMSVDKNVSAIATFDDQSSAQFHDARHFGTLKLVNDPKVHLKKLASLGPDMLSDPPDFAGFLARLHHRENKTIVEALMDQSVISGVGNYIKAECLYRARISPHRKVGDLLMSEVKLLRQSIIDVMKESYEAKGTTLRSYRSPDGSSGKGQFLLQVYGKPSDPKGNPVIKEETLDGRTTHWCKEVQK